MLMDMAALVKKKLLVRSAELSSENAELLSVYLVKEVCGGLREFVVNFVF